MLQLLYLKKVDVLLDHSHFLLFLCGIIWSLLFKTEVEQMNPSVLTFSCQQCSSVRWNKLPSPFIFYNQRCTAEYTHSPACRLCQRLFCAEQEVFVSATYPKLYTGESLFWFSPSFLASLHLLFSLSAQVMCSPLSVGKKFLGSNYFLKNTSDVVFFFPSYNTVKVSIIAFSPIQMGEIYKLSITWRNLKPCLYHIRVLHF